MRRILLGCLVLTFVTPAWDEVRLVGPTCPISIETAETVPQSSSARPTLVDQTDIGSVFLPGKSLGFVAERSNDNDRLISTCEMVLVDGASIDEVVRQAVDASSDLPIIWDEAGQYQGGKLIVDRGQYRFRFTFLLVNPRRTKGKVGLWTVRSSVFHVEKQQSWTTFR
jgi:hypothetical protein